MSERTAVYRLFDERDALLYVGISKRFGERWEQHAAIQPWWPTVHHQSVEWHPTREDALLAEKRAINEERPVHNRRGSPWEAHPKDDGTGFDVVPKVKIVTKRTGNRGTPRRNFRFAPELWTAFTEAVGSDPEGRNCSEVIRDFVAWYAQVKPDEPVRPEA